MSSDFGNDRTGDDLEQLCADTIRVLSMDGVEAAGCGHPGMPMGMADVAQVLWTEFLDVDPKDPNWIGRDRFVLSGGHGSMLIYSLLHLSGFDLPLSELKNFRQLGSHTPGHPENFETIGIETTTGPLGQGIGNAVGMALAERHLVARFPAAEEVLAQRTYCMCGDGDLQEGVSSEAASLAGHLGLGRLVILYDDNNISIDGHTELSFTEDVCKRFEAYGWHTQRIDGHDRAAVKSALDAANAEGNRPSLIACKTIIGKGAPNKQNTHGVHGSKLGAEELKLTKDGMGWPQDPFLIPDAVVARWDARRAEWAERRAAWDSDWAALDAETSTTISAWFKPGAPDLSKVEWPEFEVGKKLATRASHGQVLQAVAAAVPNLVGGSADLTPSNKTYIKDGGGDFQKDSHAGRNIRFGVREHAMGALMNGITLHGGLIPYGGTFLIFTDYMRPAIRLASLMKAQVIYIMTHDSIFLGEDGPTHQPVEQVMSLRTIPNLRLIRPADAAETALAWRMALEYQGPSVLSLTRQGVPTLDRSVYASADGALKGGYVLWNSGGDPDVVLIATGSEVQLALDVAQALHQDDHKAVRVVSLPCWKVFEAQDEDYRDSVIPPRCGARISLEAGVTLGWDRYTGSLGLKIGIDTFGASAPASALAEHFSFSPGHVLQRVRGYLEASTV